MAADGQLCRAAPGAPGPNQGCSCRCFLARHSHGRATPETCLLPCLSPWQPLPGLAVTPESGAEGTLKQVKFACLLRFFPFPSPGHLLPSVTTVKPFPTTKTHCNDWWEPGKPAFPWFAVGHCEFVRDTETSGSPLTHYIGICILSRSSGHSQARINPVVPDKCFSLGK